MAFTRDQIEAEFPIFTAEIRFLTEREGWRRTAIDFASGVIYRPHLVVQDRTIREVKRDGNRSTKHYVAMTFVEGPKDCANGDTGSFRFYCPYGARPEHPDLNSGTEFTVREGGKIVAGGIVIEKTGLDDRSGIGD